MEKKKTKLTISGNPKKSFKDFNSPKPQGKNLSSSSRGFSKTTGKGNSDKDKKSKLDIKKRDTKLTVSRALSDEIETRERSLASVKRARQKELKNVSKEEDKENLKPIKRDVNIPEAITVRELANRMAEQSSNVIKFLFGIPLLPCLAGINETTFISYN